MKILLADDEHMARLGMINMLDELYPGKHHYIEAKNGKDMMRLVAQQRPDIAFVDIKMPVMDGLSAIEQCKQISPDTRCFILSGYADFDYACKALKLGATEYLLKPIRIEELHRIIEVTEQRIEDLSAQRKTRFEQDIRLAYSTEEAAEKELSFSMVKQNDQIGIYVIRMDGKEEPKKILMYQALSAMIREGLDRQIEADIMYTLFLLSTSEFCLVTNGHAIRVNAFLEKLLAQVNGSATCVYQNGISIGMLRDVCDRLVKGLPVRVVYGYGKLLCFDQKLIEKAASSEIFTDKLFSLCRAFSKQDEINYKDTLNQMYTDKIYRNVFDNADKSCLASCLALTLGIQVDTSSYSGFIHNLINCGETMYQSADRKSEVNIFESMKDYILDNYMNDISINNISNHYGISPNYFSKIFHERIGCKFIDYLTQVRIANSKRIFSTNPNITVKKVAEMVGYKSVCHFTKTFIRLTGLLPSEYVSKLHNRTLLP